MSEDTTKKTVGSSEQVGGQGYSAFTREEAINKALEMLDSARPFFVGTIAEDNYPNIKAMSNRKHEGIRTIWFNTDTSSVRVQQLKKNNRACIYCFDAQRLSGLMLVGDMEILQDLESKKMLWRKEDEKYRPLGVGDPEYTVLRLKVKRANLVDLRQGKFLWFEIE